MLRQVVPILVGPALAGAARAGAEVPPNARAEVHACKFELGAPGSSVVEDRRQQLSKLGASHRSA